MNAINRAVTSFFDVVLTPLEAIGDEFALLFVSGVFGVLALWIFKKISAQKEIKRVKDKIKGHMIEIRLYQDDLGVVAKAVAKTLLLNAKYLMLNLVPFVPLAIPFALVAAQMVVRYGFEPVPLQQAGEMRLAGEGQTLIVEGTEDAIADLDVEFPAGVEAVSPLARIPRQGNAEIEFVAEKPGVYDIVLRTGDQRILKSVAVGQGVDVRAMQDRRVGSAIEGVLWPAEDTLAGTGLTEVRFTYPDSDLGWLPFSGPVGVLLIFILASMVVGFIFLKPLGVQI